MKKKHSQQRAEERYYISDLKDTVILSSIFESNCILINSDEKKFSHVFLIRYFNKYIRVVTDFNVQFVKTVLPISNCDSDLINKLIKKLQDNKT